MLYADIKKLFESCKDEVEMLKINSEVSSYLENLFIKESAGMGFYSRYATYAVVMGLNFDYSGNAPMWISFDGEFHFYINPAIVFEITKCEEDILFIMSHEVSHVINRDLVRYSDVLKRDIANIATDVSINDYIKICTKSSISVGMFSESLADLLGIEVTDLLSSYGTDVVYKNNAGKVVNSDVGISLLSKRIEKMLGLGLEDISYNLKVSGTSFSDELCNEANGVKSDCFNTKGSGDQETKDFCNKLSKIINSTTPISIPSEDVGDGDLDRLDKIVESQIDGKIRGRSAIGDGFRSDYKFKAAKRQVPWQSYIKVFLNNSSRDKMLTKRRINRRQPFRLELSGKRVREDTTIYVGIDESGSISNRELNYFYTELNSIVSMFPNCKIVAKRFTAVVEETKEFSSKDFKRSFKNWVNFRHNGGTCFQPVFDDIANSKVRVDKKSMIIMFTDGDGEHEIDQHGYNNVLWIISKFSSNFGLSCDESANGRIIPLVVQE